MKRNLLVLACLLSHVFVCAESTLVTGVKTETQSVSGAEIITFPETADTLDEWNGSTYTAIMDQTITVTGSIEINAVEYSDYWFYKGGVAGTGVHHLECVVCEGAETLAFNFTLAVVEGDTIILRNNSAIADILATSNIEITGDGDTGGGSGVAKETPFFWFGNSGPDRRFLLNEDE